MDDERDRAVAQPSRRRLLGMLGGLGAAVVVASCGDDGGAASSSSTAPATTVGAAAATTTAAAATTAATSATTTAASTSCTPIPEETAGPYPGDGTNGPNVLTQSGVVRNDIRSSFGSTSTTVKGVPLRIQLTVVDKATCTPRSGAAVYLWHCDAVGNYSMYSSGVTNENFLRGVQVADSAGSLAFQSIFPGAYSGRYPHIHFEVFANQAAATTGRNKIATSQLALPDAVCAAVYATSGYEQSARNFPQTPLRSDNIFRDGWTSQLAVVTGDATSGYTATLTVAV